MGKWKGPPHGEIPRCGAKTRAGRPCGNYSMDNGRCRLHGGLSSGAKNPYRNLKHGQYSKESLEQRRSEAKLLRESGAMLKLFDQLD